MEVIPKRLQKKVFKSNDELEKFIHNFFDSIEEELQRLDIARQKSVEDAYYGRI
jgi:hypothetical protein